MIRNALMSYRNNWKNKTKFFEKYRAKNKQ